MNNDADLLSSVNYIKGAISVMIPKSNAKSTSSYAGRSQSHYQRKPKIHDEEIKTTTHRKPKVYAPRPVATTIEPTEKYAKTMEYIRNKGFFVDAEYGNRIRFDQIEEFRVNSKDTPVLVVNIQYKNKRQDIVRRKKVYNIIRYNEKEIIGMATRNENYDVLHFVKIDLQPEPIPEKITHVKDHKYHR